MSRNFRQKATPPPVRKVARKTTSYAEESSDDDYGGVDQISDSEEDEPDVEKVEEQVIEMSEDEYGEDDSQATPRPNTQESIEFEYDGASLTGSMIEDLPTFDPDGSVTSGEEARNSRRVHFDVSDSETADEDYPLFPDIFLDKSQLDPSFRRQLEKDDGVDDVSDAGSYWDYGDEEATAGAHHPAVNDEEPFEGFGSEDNSGSDLSSDSDSDGMSGYDSDDDETDEDLPSAMPTPIDRSRISTDSESDSEEEVPRPRHRGPRLGSWVNRRNTPFAIIHKSGKKMIMFNVKSIPRRYSVDGTPSEAGTQIIRGGLSLQPSPMISNSGNIMMSAMNSNTLTGNLFGDLLPHGQFDPYLDGQAFGPTEAFYGVNDMVQEQHESSSLYGGSDLDDEDLWKVDDFINFGDSESSGEEDVNDDGQGGDSPGTISESARTPAPSSTPARPATATSEHADHLLNHFGTGVVGAFRRNQNRHKLLHRSLATQDSLAFGPAHMEGTIRGVKTGRLQHANTPITPVRRQKAPKCQRSSPGSPLQHASLNKKRRFDGEEFSGHKRNKSLI